jgi:hypothetical protein
MQEITASGLPWSFEVGAKHHKVKIGGRLACILPRGSAAHRETYRRALLNSRAQVRRVIKELKGDRT